MRVSETLCVLNLMFIRCMVYELSTLFQPTVSFFREYTNNEVDIFKTDREQFGKPKKKVGIFK